MEEVYRRPFQRGTKRWRKRRNTIIQLVPHTGAKTVAGAGHPHDSINPGSTPPPSSTSEVHSRAQRINMGAGTKIFNKRHQFYHLITEEAETPRAGLSDLVHLRCADTTERERCDVRMSPTHWGEGKAERFLKNQPATTAQHTFAVSRTGRWK